MKKIAYRLLCILLTAPLASGAPLAAGDIEVDGSFVSTVPAGTAPLEVASTTRVDNLNADLLDGFDSSAFALSLGNVVRVAQSGGDFASIQAALDSVTTASAASPFLVLVGPGVFAERVVMKPFVDVQGSGEGVTRITHSGGTDAERGTVAGADDAELRFLTVENTGGSAFVYGVYNQDVSPRLLHVTVEVDGTAPVVYGIVNAGSAGTPSTPELDHVTVRVDGASNAYGVVSSEEANTRIRHGRVSVTGGGSGAKWGIYTTGADALVQDVVVLAESTESAAGVTGVVNAFTTGTVVREARVEVAGGGFRTGVNNTSAELTIRDLEVTVSGSGDSSYGVFNEDATVVLESCAIDSSGGDSTTVGVYQADSSGEVHDCTVTATGGGGFESALQGFDSTGSGSYSFDVQHSRLEGADAAISVPPTYTIRVGASQLEGGIIATAPLCVFSYDGSFAALDSSCAPPSP